MANVSIDRSLAEDLVSTKLRFVVEEIESILVKWQYQSADLFIHDAREGKILEAEDDAITLRHLLDQREELFSLRSSWPP